MVWHVGQEDDALLDTKKATTNLVIAVVAQKTEYVFLYWMNRQ
jgi:hypothetical protein